MQGNRSIGVEAGQKYGRWSVLDTCIETDKGELKWLCKCDCGTERYVLERSLFYGASQSCGCRRKENAAEKVSHDLKGMIFGDLTVLGKADKSRKNGGVWWQCRCSCGSLYEVPATLLVKGRRTHCNNKMHRNYSSADITGKKTGRITALYPTDKRDKKGAVMWHCRCDCGTEFDVSYNSLVYSNMQSCGCQKEEHNKMLKGFLSRVDGTCIDIIKSKKIPVNNTVGYRGVYYIKGKYIAKIVFQQKAYYLGRYERIEDAIEARKEAEEVLFDGTAEYYKRWKEKASSDPLWAKENPMQIYVAKNGGNRLSVSYSPVL